MSSVQTIISLENTGPTRKTQPRDISKRDRLIVVLLTVAASIFLFRPVISYFNVWRGDQYAHAGRAREAARAYRKAIMLDANNAQARDGLGFAYEGQRQFKKAVIEYEKAVKLAPHTAYPHYILGMAQFRRKDYHAALPHLREAVRKDPNDFNHRRALASTYRSLGQEKKARNILDDMDTKRQRLPKAKGATE